MARTELYKVFDALDEAEGQQKRARRRLSLVPHGTLENGDYEEFGIVNSSISIDRAIAELQKAKQILTKE